MTEQEVLKIICDEKQKLDKIESIDTLTSWFWKVGFRKIIIHEDTKSIICIVSRPNKFIEKYNKFIMNFLVYLSRRVFRKLGYSFDVKKDTKDKYYQMYQELYKNN